MPRGTRRFVGTILVAVALIASLTGAGQAAATGPRHGPPKPANPSPGSFPGYEATLARYATQPLAWAPCPEGIAGFECADIVMPLDWRNPAKGEIRTDISRVLATGPNRRGILLTNPGGPGAWGYLMPAYFAQAEPALNAVYDIIGMDPRGTWIDTLSCVNSSIFDPLERLDRRDLRPQTVWTNLVVASDYARTCAADPLSKYINTDQTVRDLDLVRALLGEQKFSFVGYSAGTWLGAWYATLFPQRVDRFAFDANVDYTTSWAKSFWTQPPSFQRSFQKSLLPWLAANDATYHLGTTPDVVRMTYEARRAKLHQNPMILDDGSLITSSTYDDAIIGSLYDTATYPFIGAALAAMERLGPTTTEAEWSLITSTFGPATWVPSDNVFNAVVCNDTKALPWFETFLRGIHSTIHFPLVGAGRYADPCTFWPHRATGSPVTGKGIPKLLMVQNDGDPATAYAEGRVAHRKTPGSRLVTVKNQGDHTIYGEGNPCVEAIVNSWLIDGVMPRHDRTCPGNPLPVLAPPSASARAMAAPATQPSFHTWAEAQDASRARISSP